MLTKLQLDKMIQLQNEINCKVNPNWINANNNWCTAILAESVEAIDHHGWKWWKKQKPDMAQVQMELVDIWHFGLSHTLVLKDQNSIIDCAQFLQNKDIFIEFDGIIYDYSNMTLLNNLQLMAGLAAANLFSPCLFYFICEQALLPVNELYKQYLAKNVLNFFRQQNGYKDGSYIKIWNGREDNEWLVDIMNNVDMEDPNIDEIIHNQLGAAYASIKQ